MSDAWLASLLCRPPKILGRRLLPFSLCHAFILDRAENPYWTGGSKDAADFFEAVDICSRDWQANAAHFNSSGGSKFKRWVARQLRKTGADDVDDFVAYLQNFADTPPRDGGDSKRTMVSPWQFRIVGWLIAHGHTEDSAWNMPLNRAMCYFDAAQEMEGDESLIEQWRDDAYEMIAKANAMTDKDEAAKLHARAQAIFDTHNNATAAVNGFTQ